MYGFNSVFRKNYTLNPDPTYTVCVVLRYFSSIIRYTGAKLLHSTLMKALKITSFKQKMLLKCMKLREH